MSCITERRDPTQDDDVGVGPLSEIILIVGAGFMDLVLPGNPKVPMK